ncbi:MAG: PKD domain-containing protein [Ferruginibacter sp.]
MKRNPFALLITALLFFSCSKEVKIPVLIDFTAEKETASNTVPVNVIITNNTTGATSYKWSFEGGEPYISTKKHPGIIAFNLAGQHIIKLEASNEFETQIKEYSINLDSAVTIDFNADILINNFSPVTVHVENLTTGATGFSWTFDGGTPASSGLQQPGDVNFTSAGDHNITLTVSNGGSSFTTIKTITVAPPLAADFEIIPSFEDDDYQAPLTAQLHNSTISGTTWQWTSNGGVISDATAENPSINFAGPGSYIVTLTADNSKNTEVVTKNIIVLPNTSLRTITDVRFGILAAHGSVGSLYATRLRTNFTAADNLDTSGAWIDLAFFGFDAGFSYNKFISPDSVQNYGFDAIPQAQHTILINSQETCGCGPVFTDADFDNMADVTPLLSLSIFTTPGGLSPFSNGLTNRVVLFQTADGRRGAIKIKSFVAAGANSYILTDIKVQKN